MQILVYLYASLTASASSLLNFLRWMYRAPFRGSSQTESHLHRLPPEVLRQIWQDIDTRDIWQHRTVCRLLYDVLTDLAWREKSWRMFTGQNSVPNRELLARFGHLVRGINTPRQHHKWPRPNEWPVYFPNLTRFTVDLKLTGINSVLKDIFADCIAKLPLLAHIQFVAGEYSLQNCGNLVDCVKNLVIWINDGTLSNLTSIGMSFLESNPETLQLFADYIRLLQPVRERIKLRLQLTSQMKTALASNQSAGGIAFQDIAGALETLRIGSECLSQTRDCIIVNLPVNIISFPNLSGLQLNIPSCWTGNYSQWSPSVFPSLRSIYASVYSCESPENSLHRIPFSESSGAFGIFKHIWPKVHTFELNGDVVPTLARRLLTCFPAATTVVMSKIVPSEHLVDPIYIDKLAGNLRYAQQLELTSNWRDLVSKIYLSVSADFVIGTRVFPFLSYLCLHGFYFPSGKALAAVMSLPALANLSLMRCRLDESDSFVDEYSQSMPATGSGVTKLTLFKDYKSYSPSLIIAICKQCPRLRNYNISYGSAANLEAIRKYLPKIQIEPVRSFESFDSF